MRSRRQYFHKAQTRNSLVCRANEDTANRSRGHSGFCSHMGADFFSRRREGSLKNCNAPKMALGEGILFALLEKG